MKKILFILLFVGNLKAQTTVFYFTQQSNSRGNALNTTLDTSLNHMIANCMFWNGSAFTPLSPANCQYPSNDGLHSGVILELMKKYQEHFGGTVYGVMYSVGGTPLYDNGTLATFFSTKRGTYFDQGLSTLNTALAYMWNTLGVHSGYKFYFIPQGGENDCSASGTTHANEYFTNLTNLITGWQKNLNGSGFASTFKYVIIPKISINQGFTNPNLGIIQAACDSVANSTITGITDIISFSQDAMEWQSSPLHHTALGYKQEADYIEGIIESQ